MSDILEDLTKDALGTVDEYTKLLSLEFAMYIAMINTRTIALMLARDDDDFEPSDYIDALETSWNDFKKVGLDEEYADLAEKLKSTDPLMKMMLGMSGLKEDNLDDLRQEVEERLKGFNERVFSALRDDLDTSA